MFRASGMSISQHDFIDEDKRQEDTDSSKVLARGNLTMLITFWFFSGFRDSAPVEQVNKSIAHTQGKWITQDVNIRRLGLLRVIEVSYTEY